MAFMNYLSIGIGLPTQSSIDTLVFWIPIIDIDESIPGIELAPKSHLLGHLPTKDHQFGHTIVDTYQIDDEQFVKPHLGTGDLLVFLALLCTDLSRHSLFPKMQVELLLALELQI